jgi:hypothetical protein
VSAETNTSALRTSSDYLNAVVLLIVAGFALSACPGPSAEDAAFKRSLEERFGKPFVCETSAHSGYCCQVDKTGRFVPGYESYCTH